MVADGDGLTGIAVDGDILKGFADADLGGEPPDQIVAPNYEFPRNQADCEQMEQLQQPASAPVNTGALVTTIAAL